MKEGVEKNVWSYWEGTGKLPETEDLAVSSWSKNLDDYNIHVVDNKELRALVPPEYLPLEFDEMPEVEKNAVAGVALLRRHGGVYLSPRVIVDGTISSVTEKINRYGKRFVCVMDEETMDPSVMASKKNESMVSRLNRRSVRLGLGISATMKDLRGKNKETLRHFSNNNVGTLASADINFLLENPGCDKESIPESTVFVLPSSTDSAAPGSALRHLLDKNAIRGQGIRLRVLLDPGVQPTQAEKIPSIIMFSVLAIGMSVLLYKS